MSLSIRQTEEPDAAYLTRWLLQPDVLRFFPMWDVREVEDAVRIWINFAKFGSAITALWDEQPCGMGLLNLQPFKKLAHQCLISLIVDEQHRNKGVGTALVEELTQLAKSRFSIEILHLEVYESNPAIRLYRRLGFKEFGCQKHFIKEEGRYVGKIFMQKELVH